MAPEPSSQAKPTIKEVEEWDEDELLGWIQQNQPKLLKGDRAEKFKTAFITGKVFLSLAGNVETFRKECNLPFGPSKGLADLASELAGIETAGTLQKRKEQDTSTATEHTADPNMRKRKSSPLVVIPPSPKRIRVGGSSLVINGDLKHFRSGGNVEFSKFLQREGQAYFDRTSYISTLEKLDTHILFCRPRRFGKSLTVSMLNHFHGLQYAGEHQSLYKDLDVQKDIDEGRVKPGRYFVLKFDFSRISRKPDLTEANEALIKSLNSSLIRFYRKYAAYLGESFTDLCQNIDTKDLNISLERCFDSVQYAIDQDKRLAEGIYLLIDEYDSLSNRYLEPPTTIQQPEITWDSTALGMTFRSFWEAIKSFGTDGIIRRIFVTGISPLSLSILGSGFNVTRNLSFHKELTGLCGLTRSDLEDSLMGIFKDRKACTGSLMLMTRFFNGYHFHRYEKVETVYNTETCLAFLQCRIEGERPRAQDPENSEVSEELLRRCASSAQVIRDFEKALVCDEKGKYTPISYDGFKFEFTLKDLCEGAKGGPSWRSLVVYSGGLTFHPQTPGTLLRIPNLVAAERIIRAVLNRFNLRDSLPLALQRLAADGELEPTLGCYRRLMTQRDDNPTDLTDTTEERHRDSFYFCLLRSSDLAPRVEFKVTKPDQTNGRIDLLFEVSGRLVVTEWKFYRINFLNVPGADEVRKAKNLYNYELQQILQLRFSFWDTKHRDEANPDRIYTIQEWVEEKEAPQLRSYIRSKDVQQLRIKSKDVHQPMQGGTLELLAYFVIIVGSRHILLWDMDENGILARKPRLVEMPRTPEKQDS